jgi:glycosyltransferase involved in cell wall biosynthesis
MVVGPTWQKPLLDLLMILTLYRVVRQEGIDLIHAHNYEGALIGYGAKLLTGKRLIYNAVNTMGDELPAYNFIRPEILASRLAKALDYWVPRVADRIMALSGDLGRFLQAQGIKPEDIHVIPLGIDTSPFEAVDGDARAMIRERFRIGESPLVMYTGILDRFQRVDYLLKAMRLVADAVGNARLLLVANVVTDQDLQASRAMIEELDLHQQAEIVAGTSFEEIPRFLAAADVLVLPRPQCPGFPVKLLNYMAAGKPIVLFKGSAKGLRHLQQAFVVADHDWHALGQGIVTLLQHPVLAETLGHNARQWAYEHYAWPQIAEQIEAVYYDVLAR